MCKNFAFSQYLTAIACSVLAVDAYAAPPPEAVDVLKRAERTYSEVIAREPQREAVKVLEQHTKQLLDKWDETIKIDSKNVPPEAQWWHKMLQFYFWSNHPKFSSEISLLFQAPKPYEINTLTNSNLPDDCRYFVRDYEIPGMIEKGKELRVEYLRSFANLGFQQILKRDKGYLLVTQVTQYADQLFRPPFLDKLNRDDIEVICNYVLLGLNLSQADLKQGGATSEHPLRAPEKILISYNQLLPESLKKAIRARPELFEPEISALLAQSEAKLENIRKFLSGIKNDHDRRRTAAMVLASLDQTYTPEEKAQIDGVLRSKRTAPVEQILDLLVFQNSIGLLYEKQADYQSIALRGDDPSLAIKKDIRTIKETLQHIQDMDSKKLQIIRTIASYNQFLDAYKGKIADTGKFNK